MAYTLSPETREAQLWLLKQLSHEPQLMRSVVATAVAAGLDRTVVQGASRHVPILRKPRELRGPWVWWLPEDDALVPVRYRCPLTDCGRVREGWMPFGLSRRFFVAGLVQYRIRGRLRRSLPPDGVDEILVFDPLR